MAEEEEWEGRWYGAGLVGVTPEEREILREQLEARPKPTTPITYDVREAALWEHRYIPPGSVLVYDFWTEAGDSLGEVAIFVDKVEQRDNGIWLDVRFLGCLSGQVKGQLQRYFKGDGKLCHLCYMQEGGCPVLATRALHLDQFTWHPPGDFDAPWLSNAARKIIQSGVKLAAGITKGKAAKKKPPPPPAEAEPVANPSLVEDRLSALKKKVAPRVTFGDLEGKRAPRKEAASRATPILDGVAGEGQPLALARAKAAPSRPIKVESDGEEDRKKTKPMLDQVLARAADSHRKREEKKERRKSRSRSSRRRKKRKKRKRSSSSQDSKESSQSRSSSRSMMAPLKRKSRREPGSVFRMLEQQAVEHLAQDGLMEETAEERDRKGQHPRMYTYFQLALRPHLDVKTRDAKELALLARSLDLLRAGHLAELADLLSSRMMAVEAASRLGWQAARHLEIFGVDQEEGMAPPHVLLSTMKHARQVERAGGKGSWSRPPSYPWSDWGYEPKGKTKGKDPKGKGKKGKAKGKSGKGWGQAREETTDHKQKGGDGET